MTTAYCAIIETKQNKPKMKKKNPNQIKQQTNKPQNLQQQKIWKKKTKQLWSWKKLMYEKCTLHFLS